MTTEPRPATLKLADSRMAITPDGVLKPAAEFTGAEVWWCDCEMRPGPHVHHPPCHGGGTITAVDLETGMGIDDPETAP